jgi:hypothetical protein
MKELTLFRMGWLSCRKARNTASPSQGSRRKVPINGLISVNGGDD